MPYGSYNHLDCMLMSIFNNILSQRAIKEEIGDPWWLGTLRSIKRCYVRRWLRQVASSTLGCCSLQWRCEVDCLMYVRADLV